MPRKGPGYTATTNFALYRLTRDVTDHLGLYSTQGKAEHEAERLIAHEAGLRNLRNPPWANLPNGKRALVYGRDGHSWHFQIAAWAVDGGTT